MKGFRLFVLILATIMTVSPLCGCVQTDDGQYEADKAACFAFITENEDKLDRLLSLTSEYGCSMDIYLDSDGAVSISVYRSPHNYSESEIMRKLKNSEAYSLAQELLSNEYVDAITILWTNGARITDAYNADPDIPVMSVHFINIRKGHFCVAKTDNGKSVYDGAEHITGDWYYTENIGE